MDDKKVYIIAFFDFVLHKFKIKGSQKTTFTA